MRHAMVWALVAVVAAQAGCKDGKQVAAQRSAAEALNHVRQAREGVARLTAGFQPLLDGLAPSLAPALTRNSRDDARYELIGMRSRQMPGGSLSFYPTGFVAAVGADGRALARDQPEADDRMAGVALAPLFAAVRTALTGSSASGVGEFPAEGTAPSRVYYVAASPVRAAPGGPVLGALVAGISFGQLARALDTPVREHAGQSPVLWVGLRHAGRVLPSGTDRDVAPRWLVPATLTSRIPHDADARVRAGGGQFAWTFIEDEVRGWGGALGTVPPLDDTEVLIFRSEAEQH